jgi:hypothetical protein
MESTITKPKRQKRILLLIVISCLFIFTGGQYIPVYFKSNGLRDIFYLIIWIILVITSGKLVFQLIYNPAKNNISLARLFSIITVAITFFIFGFWTIGLLFNAWSEAHTYWVRKDDPRIKIISAYVDEGAFGGGTEASDYHVVLHRPFLYIFRIETEIDTTTINKNDWKIPDLYNANDIKGIWYESSSDNANQVAIFNDTTVTIKDNGQTAILNYAIEYDSLAFWKQQLTLKMKNKILGLSDSDLMFIDSTNKTKGLRLFYRKQE